MFCPTHFYKLNEKGQTTLVIVVMVLAVSLAVGVAASNRAITNIRRSTNVGQSDQAYHCAEAGAETGLAAIENALTSGQDPLSNPQGTQTLNDPDNVSLCSYDYTISTLENADGTVEYLRIAQDDVQEINLRGYTGNLDIYFNQADSGSPTSLEVTFITGSAGSYDVEKVIYSCEDSSHANGAFSVGQGNGGSSGLTCGIDTVTISGDYQLARVRPLFGAAHVIAQFSDDVPLQGYKVLSVGTAGQAVRKIEATRSNSQMPALFDYAIFSNSDLTK